MPGTLKCHGVVRELKEVGRRGGREVRGIEKQGLAGRKREIQPHRARLRAYLCVLDVALARLLRQTRCRRRFALCHYVSGTARVDLRRLGSTGGGHCTVQTHCRCSQLAYSRVSGPAIHPLHLTASLKSFEGFMVSLQLLTVMDFCCVLD